MRTAIPIACVFVMACGPGAIAPAELRLGEDACAHCRMTLVDLNTAAQIVAPGEEAVAFDEIGCLRDYIAAHPLSETARVFVADHRTRSWVDGDAAVFTQTGLQTPMSSGLLAHADAASRDADAGAAGGAAVDAASILHRRTASP